VSLSKGRIPDGFFAATQTEVADAMGISRARVQQLEYRALNKLRARYPELAGHLHTDPAPAAETYTAEQRCADVTHTHGQNIPHIPKG